MSSSVRDRAWGLRFECDLMDSADLVEGAAGWASVDVSVSIADSWPDRSYVGEEEAGIVLLGGGFVRLDRERRTSTILVAEMPSVDALVHPLLTSTAVVMNHWLGRTCLHAGGVVVDGAVWALAGQRTYGKSTALAWFAREGFGVLTDDMLVVEDGAAFAGPRCLDLRDGAAARLGMGRELGKVGTRERWRVRLADVAPTYPLRGVVLLDWSDDPDDLAVDRVPAREALPELFEHLALAVPPAGIGMLDIAGLPTLRWTRPKSWDMLDRAARVLIDTLAG